MNIAELHKRDPAQNMAGSYRIWVTPTLFGDYAVVREWGRIGSPGTVREEWFESEAEAIQDGLALCRRKERRGYRSPS